MPPRSDTQFLPTNTSIISNPHFSSILSMARDHYEVLGVRQSATEASIRRAIQTSSDQITGDTSISELERESRLAELLAAADALSTPAKRDKYDALLLLAADPKAGMGAAGLLNSPTTWLILCAIGIVVGGLYWQYDREQTRQRVERERVAEEQQEERRAKEFEAQRARDKQRLLEELREQRAADDKLRQESNEIRSADSQKKQYIADDRHVPTPPSNYGSNYDTAYRNYEDQRQIASEAQRREMDERKQKYEEEMNLRRAKAEVERQKRYLEQREREEEYAKARREAASKPNRY